MITLSLHLRWPASQVVTVSLPQGGAQAAVHVQGMFDDNHRVPDVDRYIVETHSGAHQLNSHHTREFELSSYSDRTPQNTHRNIVVLLESPHKDEYTVTSDTLLPIAPAHGTTGRNIACHLCGYFDVRLNGVPDNYMNLHARDSHVVICNPIQFQASLHAGGLKLTAKSKVKVWERLWNVPGVQNDFLQRLIHYRPHVIINACTKTGRSDGGCKKLVRTFLHERRDVLPSPCHVYEAPHPSSHHFAQRTGFCYTARRAP